MKKLFAFLKDLFRGKRYTSIDEVFAYVKKDLESTYSETEEDDGQNR